MSAPGTVEPMYQELVMEFPYKHSTGDTVGRFLAGLKEQKTIWGRRVAGLGVAVPPMDYSEVDASPAGDWVAVQDTGTITAAAIVREPIARLHPFDEPFAYALIKLDGADTALAHVVKGDLGRIAVGARVQAEWAADEARVGSVLDIACFRVVG